MAVEAKAFRSPQGTYGCTLQCGLLMSPRQCHAELQTAKMKEYVDKAVGNLQSAVLNGTDEMIKDAAKALSDATDKNKYALQYAVLNETQAQITTAMEGLSRDLSSQMTAGFDQMSNHLDVLEGGIPSWLKARMS